MPNLGHVALFSAMALIASITFGSVGGKPGAMGRQAASTLTAMR